MLLSLCTLFKPKEKRLYATVQHRPYIHLRASQIYEYIIVNGAAVLPFSNQYRRDIPQKEANAVDAALAQYLNKKGIITQSTVVILLGELWAGKFSLVENENPNTLILALE